MAASNPSEWSYPCSGCGAWIVPPENPGDPDCPVYSDGKGGYFHVPGCLPAGLAYNGATRTGYSITRPEAPTLEI